MLAPCARASQRYYLDEQILPLFRYDVSSFTFLDAQVPMSTEAFLAVGVLLLSILAWWFKRPSGMPPGPPRTLLGDNRSDVSPKHPWRTFTEWNQRYGRTCV